MSKIIFYSILFSNLFVKFTFAHEFIATITKVHDGDTFSATVYDKEETKIRLLDVDCFETAMNKRAAFQQKLYHLSYDEIFKQGKVSKAKLKHLLQNHRYIRVQWEKRDSFGRILGKVFIDDIKSNDIIDVSEYMLSDDGCNKYVSQKQ